MLRGKKMAIRLWIASWNCENQAPDDKMLDDFIVNDVKKLLPRDQPDLIVIGLQEATKNSLINGKFVSERLAKHKRLGTQYDHVNSISIKGVTKGHLNYIQMGILQKKYSGDNPNQGRIYSIQEGSYKDSIGGKGGVFVKLVYSDNTLNIDPQTIADLNNCELSLCFINAHLDSNNNQKRDQEITELLRKCTNLDSGTDAAKIRQSLDNQFNSVFFMGDLNYRLAEGTGISHQTTTVGKMVSLIETEQGRKTLVTLDTFCNSSLVDEKQYGFTFPSVAHLLPTYKRNYKDRTANNPCLQLANKFAENQQNQQNLRDLIRDCYFPGQQDSELVKYNSKRDAFDLGWLDRIGYRNNVPLTVLEFIVKNDIVLSDHTPVILKVQVG